VELPDPIQVLKGAAPPIVAALLFVGAAGARWLALAVAVGTFVAFWLLKERPEWPHELWVAPDGRQWLLWGLIAAALVASLEHARLLRGRAAATVGAAVAAFAVWLVLQKVATHWEAGQVALHVGGGAAVSIALVLVCRQVLARAPANLAPAVVFTVLLSADAVLLTVARSGLFGQLCGAVAAALGAGAGTALWRKPFALAPADGIWLGAAHGLFVLAGVHLAELPWSAAACALLAPAALLLVPPGAKERPVGWCLAVLCLIAVPMVGAFWFALDAVAERPY
jgi:hypothetical protein